MSAAALPLLIPLATVFTWTLAVWLIAKMGWAPLAEAYPAKTWPARGLKVRWRSGGIGAVSYSSALNAAVTPEGLHLRPTLLFRAGHPPVFVPWAAFVDTAPAMFWSTRFVLKSAPDLTFGGRLARAITAALQLYHEAAAADLDLEEHASGEHKSGDLPWEAAAEARETRPSRREGRRRA